MAWRKSQRYLIERSNQDAKDELVFPGAVLTRLGTPIGFDHLGSLVHCRDSARLDSRFKQDPDLLAQYEVEVLPQLSVGNVRELLRAALPLPHLSS